MNAGYRVIDILEYFILSKLVRISNSPRSLLSWVSVFGLDLGSTHHYWVLALGAHNITGSWGSPLPLQGLGRVHQRVLAKYMITTGTDVGGDAASMAAKLVLACVDG